MDELLLDQPLREIDVFIGKPLTIVNGFEVFIIENDVLNCNPVRNIIDRFTFKSLGIQRV